MKDKVGRNRYVVFRVDSDGAPEMLDVISALREASRSRPRESRPFLVFYERGLGIVRCPHTEKEKVIEFLQSMRTVGRRDVTITTLGTTGTIRKAREKYISGPRSREGTGREYA